MGTHYQGNEEEIRALNLYIKLTRAAEAVNARVNQHLADVNLTVSQFGVLEALFHLGPMCQKDLAQKILKSTGNLTFVINNLEKRSLVERRRSIEDRRYVDIYLTPAGQQVIQEIFPHHVDIVKRELAVLTSEEQDELSRLARKVGLHEN